MGQTLEMQRKLSMAEVVAMKPTDANSAQGFDQQTGLRPSLSQQCGTPLEREREGQTEREGESEGEREGECGLV